MKEVRFRLGIFSTWVLGLLVGGFYLADSDHKVLGLVANIVVFAVFWFVPLLWKRR